VSGRLDVRPPWLGRQKLASCAAPAALVVIDLLKLGAGTVQACLQRSGRTALCGGNLWSGVATVVLQYQRLAIAGRELRQRQSHWLLVAYAPIEGWLIGRQQFVVAKDENPIRRRWRSAS
jgi:hypothetical protein